MATPNTSDQQSPTDPSGLRLVFWETTAGCNLECVHCRRLDVAHELMKNDLSTAEGYRLIDQIADTARPVLVFSGGEPLIRPDLFELAAHAKSRALPIALASNGTLIDGAMADRIARAGFDRVSISLDGADAETHDAFRGLSGAFTQALGALDRLRTAGVATQINCTIARHDQEQLGRVLDIGRQVGVVAVHYFLLVPVGCGEEIAADQMLSPAEVEERLLEIYDLAQGTDLQIKATCAPHYYRILRQRGRDSASGADKTAASSRPGHPGTASLHSVTKGCLAGTAVCFVSHEGRVFPCGYLPVSAGDVRKQSFGEIWRDSPVFADLRDPGKLTGKCGRCEFKRVCGGCRARAFQETGDYLTAEPFCTYEPLEHKDQTHPV